MKKSKQRQAVEETKVLKIFVVESSSKMGE